MTPRMKRELLEETRTSCLKLLEEVARGVAGDALGEATHEVIVFQILDTVGTTLITVSELADEGK